MSVVLSHTETITEISHKTNIQEQTCSILKNSEGISISSHALRVCDQKLVKKR